jgi:hypothetical protein
MAGGSTISSSGANISRHAALAGVEMEADLALIRHVLSPYSAQGTHSIAFRNPLSVGKLESLNIQVTPDHESLRLPSPSSVAAASFHYCRH